MYLGTKFENRLIDALENISKMDNPELEQRLEKLESIIENLSPPTTNSSLRNGINAQFIKKSGKHNYLWMKMISMIFRFWNSCVQYISFQSNNVYFSVGSTKRAKNSISKNLFSIYIILIMLTLFPWF